ncbi:MAG: NusG domain II-containing protein [Eubacteriales bacterium]|nr:NusG domain II-containing protein [Eubacteriales bacterium]
MIKKADIFLFIVLVILGLIISYLSVADSVTGTKAIITVDGKVYGIYSLTNNQTITVKENDHLNKITIKDGAVSMSFSDCHNQICVHHSPISKTKESIVCLPNKVMVEIVGGTEKEDDLDAISN